MKQPLVSVIVPVYNTERYLEECLDSVLNQSLEEIEVICVNDGSTDSSLEILNRYRDLDSRVTIIDKPNAGYGHTMNMGLLAARGKYVAFLESDDYIESNAYETLAGLAELHDLDIVKANYFLLFGSNGSKRVTEERLSNTESYGKVFRPLSEPWSFYIPMMNCLGLFSRKMIIENGIAHNETPGAAHQDVGFWFQTLCFSNRMMLVDEPFYVYRQDNPSSSIHNDKIVFSTKAEYDYIWERLSAFPNLMEEAQPLFFHRKYTSCMYSYLHADLAIKLPFLRSLAHDYEEALRLGVFSFERFNEGQKADLERIIDNPDLFFLNDLDGISREYIDTFKLEIMSLREKNEILQRRIGEESCLENPHVSQMMLSIVIPVYNSERYLEECLDSILSHKDDRYEVICVDDGSTDKSLEILKAIAKADKRVKVLSQEHQGQSAARNLGMTKACGEYIQFVDSDDFLRGGSIARILEILEEKEAELIIFNADTIYESEELEKRCPQFKRVYKRQSKNNEIISGLEMFRRLKKENEYCVAVWLAIIERDLLAKKRIVFPEGIIYEDNVFYMKALLSAEKVKQIDDIFYTRRIREDSTMTKADTAKNVISYFEVYLELLKYSTEVSVDVGISKAIADEMKKVKHQIRTKYKNLSPAERIVVMTQSPAKQTLMDLFTAEAEYAKIKAELEKEKKKLKKIKQSNSWKIGRAATFPVRKLKRILGE